jgi:lipopolysaccharide biosynthesis protein
MVFHRIFDSPRVASRRRNEDVTALADRARDARQWSLAAELYKEALDRKPSNPPIWVQYGHVMKEWGELRDPNKLAQAETAYRRAFTLDPAVADTYLQLGHVLKLQGKMGEAQAAYLRAISVDSSLTEASFELRQLGWSETHFSELRRMTVTNTANELAHVTQAPDLFELRGLKPRGRIAVVLHLYYPDVWDEIRRAIGHIRHPFDLFVSLVKGSSEQLRISVKQAFPKAYIFDFENRGRDLGPFLAFVQSGALFQYDLVCKLHTKRSPHRRDGDEWRNRLVDGVLGSPQLVDRIISSFSVDNDLGIVVADGNIYSGEEHWTLNDKLLAELLPRVGISPEVKGRSFPGGSIFWIRPFLLRTLAAAEIKLHDFEREPIAPNGGLPHALERMFGLICEDAGMRVVESGKLPERVQKPAPSSSKVHIIAFYLPQFYPIKENNEWWGSGFTEWQNVTRAKPLFRGHRQPRLPSDLGFYDLRLPEIREAQAELARHYGLTAFCYYYYWFDERRVLELPLNEVLAGGKPDFPFLICWANEPWTRNWDGLNRDVLLPQTYKQDWTIRFARDIAPLVRDRRYFRLNGKPVLLIYRIGHIPAAQTAMRQLRVALSDLGIPDVHLTAAWVGFEDDANLPADPSALDLDSYFEFPPHSIPVQPLRPLPSGLPEAFAGDIYDYNRTITAALATLENDRHVGPLHRSVMVGWDSTARRDLSAHIFHGATPANFRRWLRHTIEYQGGEDGERIIFINAWNEWGEGTYLEPDRDFGRGWLEAVASATQRS